MGDPAGALREVAAAVEAQRAGDWHAYRSLFMARISGVAAYLGVGDLDGAAETMAALSAPSAERRVVTLGQRRAVRSRCSTVPGTPASRALALREAIAEFRRGTAVVPRRVRR